MTMQAVSTLVILAFLSISSVFAIESYSPKTTIRPSKIKVRQSFSEGTKCGTSATAPNGGRIVGGVEARPHSWPWQVLIQCTYVLFDDLVVAAAYCGGSIISDKWVITAAHCVEPAIFDIRRRCQIFLGKHDLQRNESTEQIGKIAAFFVHEKYDPDEHQNAYDLALYKLAKPLKFSQAIKPICLPFGLPEVPYNKSCYVTGWGLTKYDNRAISDRLMQLLMTVTDEKYCFKSSRIICTARWDRNKDVCDGDSGGPLACQEHDRKWYLRGVLSMGSKNCDFGAMFTKVASFEKWIKNITSHY